MSDERTRVLLRRDVLCMGGAALASASCAQHAAPVVEGAAPTAGLLRVATVPTAVDGGLLPKLVEDYAAAAGAQVALLPGEDVYDVARRGQADLVISHYGHEHAEAFVLEGLGRWPRTLFSNQLAIVGPPDDPAQVREADDAVEALRRIAKTKSLFYVNDIDGNRYVVDLLWHAIGRPPRDGWLVDAQAKKGDAMAKAAAAHAYTIWGLTPFLKYRRATQVPLEPLVVNDPLLQRMLVSIVVRDDRIAGARSADATRFEQFLLHPRTQARIREVTYTGCETASWTPGGRNNRTSFLPKDG